MTVNQHLSAIPAPNRILFAEQTELVLRTLLINRPLKLIKFLAKTGKYRQSCPWIYVENEITGDRYSTFVSLDDFLRAFWTWIETAQVMFMAFWQRIAISKVVWSLLDVGEEVYNAGYGWGKIVEKIWDKGIPRFAIAFERGNRIENIISCEVEIF